MRQFLASAIALTLCGSAAAQVRINEYLANVPGTDQGGEFIELRSTTPSYSLAGLTLIMIDGDSTAAGAVDQALSLGSLSTGTNGLLLWRDSATVLSPAPDPATTLNVADFSPDIENGSLTMAIVSGWTGSIGADLDTDNDGVIDVALPWTSVVDAVSILEDDGVSNFGYGAALGGTAFPQTTFGPDAFAVNGSTRLAFDVLGTAPGPFPNDTLETINSSGAFVGDIFDMTPGSTNVPEPASLALLALGGIFAIRRR